MTFEDFIARFEKRSANGHGGVMVRCPAHDDRKASLSVDRADDGGVLIKCFANCRANEIVAALGLELKDLFANEQEKQPAPTHTKTTTRVRTRIASNGHVSTKRRQIEKAYSYTDPLGRELYQAVRYEGKQFSQRHAVNGEWVWSMDGVERVLYRLPEVLKAEEVWVVEGEKDADNLAAWGYCATTNVGGAGKWLDGYTESLAKKRIVICGDNDKPGQDHVELVFDSVSRKAESVRIVKLPSSVKDVSDFITENGEDAKERLDALLAGCVPHYGGVRLPVYSMADIEPRYHKLVTQSDAVSINLAKWLPSLKTLRPLVPGNFALFVGDTGIGKTILLQNVYSHFAHLPTLFFELELTAEELFERFFANQTNAECRDVEADYKSYGCFGPAVMMDQFPNLYICPEPRLTVENFEEIVVKSELKMGVKPLVVMLDYFQLVKASRRNDSRYEKASDVAESVKQAAKATGTIVIGASQIDRASGRKGGVGLHSAKDSGSLENSAGVVIGASRDPKDQTLLVLTVLKATKGGAGTVVMCNIDGAKIKITERTRQEAE